VDGGSADDHDLLFGVAPAVLLAIAGFWFRWLGIAGALFAAGALIADVLIWTEIVSEFAPKTAH
jgi:hypothetical protein